MPRSLLLFLVPAALSAQTPAKAPPCPASSVLLSAQPIYGVGLTTIRNACPAFLSSLERWYAGHPSASIADLMAAIRGVPISTPVPPVITPPVMVQPQPSTPNPSPSTLASVDFSQYPSDSLIQSLAWWKGAGRDDGGVTGFGRAIRYDPVERAMRYDWAPRDSTAACSLEQTVALMPRLNPPPPGARAIWVRFTSKESPNFEHGKTGCGGRSYKFFLIQFERGSTNARVGTYLFDAGQSNAAPAIPTTLYMDGIGARGGLDIGGVPSWGGQYHTWVLGLEGIGTDTAAFSVYLDGRHVHTLRGPFLSGHTLGTGWAVTFEMGANINSGPDHAQSRWWKEIAILTAKPSNLP